ncbi:MAG: hypothetical protein LBG77_05190 [Dysgonamonadaceae bacterium]|jgi:hypothetical protein|nr:hypothetical protein [Dysgonamonadaceae bacterium]
MRKIIFAIIAVVSFYACETSEDISLGMDHEVPSYYVLTDTLYSRAGQTVDIKIDVSDNAGLNKLVFSYGEWLLRESVTLADKPKNYTFEISVFVPEDAKTEWQEEVILNDGSKKTVTQNYHKLLLEATDISMNVRKIPFYICIFE